MAEWFYGKDNTQHGPVPEQEIQTLLSTGKIDIHTMIWREGITDWLPLKDVSEFQALAASGTTIQSSTPNQQGSMPPNTQSPLQQTIAAPTDNLAIFSLVFGILAVVICYIWALFGIPAVICGHMSLKKINNSPTPLAGKGMAIAGLITGYIGIVFQLFVIIGFTFAFISATSNIKP